MNLYGIRAIYNFEMARMKRTVMQSVLSPVISTCLYFVVFGSAIGSRMGDIDNIAYGAYIIPGLVMLSLLMQSISNASFGIYMPKFSGTIYEVLSAPVSYVEVWCWAMSVLLPPSPSFLGLSSWRPPSSSWTTTYCTPSGCSPSWCLPR